MFAMPDAGQLVELAASLNLYLSRRDAGLYLPFIRDAMHELDTFVQSRTDAAARPWLFPERGLGYRASLPGTATRPGSGSAPSAARTGDCWPARRSASRTI